MVIQFIRVYLSIFNKNEGSSLVKNRQLSVIDFFCGAGGFSEGFRQLGFKIVRGYDNWSPAIQTYNHNFNLDSEVKDVLSFSSVQQISNIPDTDVILGSPPCVTFSSSNNSGKANKESGVLLIKTFLRIVAVKKYQKNSILKAWFMENVPNSIKYLPEFYTFEALGLSGWAKQNGYSENDVAIQLKGNQPIINSADYGSYQARRRVVSGEIINCGKLIVPVPTHSETDKTKLEWKKLGELLKQIPPPNHAFNSEKLVVDPIYPVIQIPISNLTDQFYDSGIYEVEWRQALHQKTNHPYMGRMSFPENLTKPSRTLTATKSITSREAFIYKSERNRKGDGEYRIPTVREAATIMGFPYTYQFLGSLNTKWRLVGNAVCPAVSRAFAEELLKQLSLPVPDCLTLNKSPNIHGVASLNDFKSKEFDNAPIRTKNSRFRRHPVKDGNLTVTLSNYDIERDSDVEGCWRTSIQYGTGDGFPIQSIADNFYLEIESEVKKFKNGDSFVEKVGNGFMGKIGSAKKLQKMYESQKSEANFLEPTALIAELANMIAEANVANEVFIQDSTRRIFKYKGAVPATQLFALYAVNKISTIANKKP